MYAVEFTSKIVNGKIDIPKKFLDEFTSDVKVILLKPDYNDTAYKESPSLLEQEKTAWERHAIETFDNL